MHDRRGLVWAGNDEGGYTGNVNGVALYKIRTVPYAPGPRRKDERQYLYRTRRLNTRGYEPFNDTPRADTADDAKAQCENDFRNGGRAALHKTLGHALTIVEAFGFCVSKPKTPKHKDHVSKPTLADALAVARAAGFRISKPKTPKRKNQVGPTFVCEFADGVVTRMSVHTQVESLDWARGERLSQAAYQSRWRAQYRKRYGEPCPVDEITLVPPAIVSARFEQNGVVLAQRNGGGVT